MAADILLVTKIDINAFRERVVASVTERSEALGLSDELRQKVIDCIHSTNSSIPDEDRLNNCILFSDSFNILYAEFERNATDRVISAETTQKIKQVFQDTFQETRASNWKGVSQAVFKQYYGKFLNEKGGQWPYAQQYRNLWLHGNYFNLDDVDVTCPEDYLKAMYEQHGVIVTKNPDTLSEAIDFKTMLIGCGHARFSNEGNYDLEPLEPNDAAYSLQHRHSDAVTIDPDLSVNPTVCAFFSLQPIAPLFPEKHFDKIIFEGTFGEYEFGQTPSSIAINDVQQLLAPSGSVVLLDATDGEETDITARFFPRKRRANSPPATEAAEQGTQKKRKPEPKDDADQAPPPQMAVEP